LLIEAKIMVERFRYSANALGLSIAVHHPFTASSSFPSAVLGSTGGSAGEHSENYRLEDIFSVRSASVIVRGGRSGDGESYETLATVRLEGLNVMDMFTADVIVGRLAAQHRGRESGWFSALGCQIQNLRIAGKAVEPRLDIGSFERANYKTLAERFQKDRGFRERTNDQDMDLKSGQSIVVSLVEKLESRDHQGSVKGNSITIPQFGTVYFCEVLVSPTTWKLEMLHLGLGSPVEGEITAASVDVNGTWYP
jgi:hypothetical protein